MGTIFIDIDFYCKFKGDGKNHYWLTKRGLKTEITFSQALGIITNKKNEVIKSEYRYSEAHYTIYIPNTKANAHNTPVN